MDMATACMISAMNAGVRQLKVSVSNKDYPSLTSAARIMQVRGDSMGVCASINVTELEHTVERMSFLGAQCIGAFAKDVAVDDEKIV